MRKALHILVTGGAGYIGSHLTALLIDLGHQVTVYDSFANSSLDVICTLKAEAAAGQLLIERGDIRDPARLERVLKKKPVDAVVHLAALKSVSESFRKAALYDDVNVNGTLVLAKAMERAGVRTLVYCSTAAVYDDGQEMPLTEASRTFNPPSPYGRSKRQAEEALASFAAAHPTCSIGVMRCFNPIGANPDRAIGQASLVSDGGLMENLRKVSSGEIPFFSIYGVDYPTPDGTALRDYIHVMDLAEAFAAALISLPKSSGLKLWNVGSGAPTSVLDILREYERASGRKLPIRREPGRVGDQHQCWCKPSLIHEELGWIPRLSIAQMIKDELRWASRIEGGSGNWQSRPSKVG